MIDDKYNGNDSLTKPRPICFTVCIYYIYTYIKQIYWRYLLHLSKTLTAYQSPEDPAKIKILIL